MELLDDSVDHVRGGSAGRVIVEYGDYECPYSRKALTEIHPHALAASAAAEAAALQGQFWEMHALEDGDLRGYAAELGLDLERFDADWASAGVLARVGRDVQSGLASGVVLGTPTLFIDGVVHGSYDAASLLQEVTVS
jgi:protein-disulfide isomerase